MESMARQLRINELLPLKRAEEGKVLQAEVNLEMHRAEMRSNKIKNMFNKNIKLLTMFDESKETSLLKARDEVAVNIARIDNQIKELRLEEARYAEAVRIIEARRLAEMERVRVQAEWDGASLLYKPVLYAKNLVNNCRSRRQGKKHRKNSHKKSKGRTSKVKAVTQK